MARKDQSRETLSRSEWKIMDSIWRHCPADTNITVSELIKRTSREHTWNFSTLKTMMERLVKKGMLASEIRGNTCFYSPRVPREKVVRETLPEFLEVMLDGAFGPLVAYLAEKKKLTPKQRAQLEALLSEEDHPTQEK